MKDAGFENEKWEAVEGYEGYYSVSDHGRVRSEDRTVEGSDARTMRLEQRIMKQNYHGSYSAVQFSKDSETGTYRVHRLVAETFIPNPGGKGYVNHKDRDPYNNHVDNLEWVSHAENLNHMSENQTSFENEDAVLKTGVEEAIAYMSKVAKRYRVDADELRMTTVKKLLTDHKDLRKATPYDDERVPDQDIIEHIRRYRKGECTQKECAQVLNVSQALFSLINSGKRRAYLQDLI